MQMKVNSSISLEDSLYLKRCIELASKASKNTKINPNVGAVLVHDGMIIGEGYHEKFGGEHAEVKALNAVKPCDKPLIPLSTLYVSLEPCSHYGKTPPCAHRIILEKIPKVVIATLDPNPIVKGNGVKILRDAGIEVVCDENNFLGRHLIKKFEVNLSKKPYVVLKWAKSYDNFISHNLQKTQLSNKFSQILTHKWRTQFDAILVGKNTVMVDNPMLNSRHYVGDNPIIVLLDSHLSLNENMHVFKTQNKCIVFNSIKNETLGKVQYIKLGNMYCLETMLAKLFECGIYSVLVEGGSKVLDNFIAQKQWHEARIINTHKIIHDGIKAPLLHGHIINKTKLMGDIIVTVIPNPE